MPALVQHFSEISGENLPTADVLLAPGVFLFSADAKPSELTGQTVPGERRFQNHGSAAVNQRMSR